MATVTQDVADKTSAVVTSASPKTVAIAATTLGDFLIAIVDGSSTVAPSPTGLAVTDSAAQTWTKAVGINPSLQKTFAEIWYCPASAAGVTSVTITPSATTPAAGFNMGVRILAATGMATATPVDVTATSNNGGNTSPSSGSLTTSNAVELIVGTLCIGASSPTITLDTDAASWTHADTQNSSLATNANLTEKSGYDVTTVAGLHKWSGTLLASASYAGCAVAFKTGAVSVPETLPTQSDVAGRDVQAFAETAPDTIATPDSTSAVAHTGHSATAADTILVVSDSAQRAIASQARTAAETLHAMTDTALYQRLQATDTIGGGPGRAVIDAASQTLHNKGWWSQMTPTGGNIPTTATAPAAPLGGINISWQPDYDGLDGDRPQKTRINGNGYGEDEMKPTTGPVLTPGTTTDRTVTNVITAGHDYSSATIAISGGPITIAKNQTVRISDGVHTWDVKAKNAVNAGVSFVAASNVVNGYQGSTAPFGFAAGADVKLGWEVAVLETFRGLQDSADPLRNPGSTATTTTFYGGDGVTLNIAVTYTPSCPRLGDYTAIRTYRVLMRPAGATTTTFQWLRDVQTNAIPPFSLMTITAATVTRVFADGVTNHTSTLTSATAGFVATDVGAPVKGTGIPSNTNIQSVTNATTIVMTKSATTTATGVSITTGGQYSTGNFTGFNNASHDQHVDIRVLLLYSKQVHALGESAYQSDYDTLKEVVNSEFSNDGGGLRPWHAPLLIQLYDLEPVPYVGLVTGKTFEAIALQYTQDLYLKNYYTPNVGMYVDVTATKNPSPGGNTALGKARFEYGCQAAALFYLAGNRTWSASSQAAIAANPGGGSQADWLAAAASISSHLGSLGNATTFLPYQDTYVDSSGTNVAPVHNTPVFTGATITCKAADVLDGVHHLLYGYTQSGNADAGMLSLAKNILGETGGQGLYNSDIHDTVHGAFWNQIGSDGTGVDRSYKEAGRLGYGLGVYRQLTVIEPTGGWETRHAEWQDFVINKSFNTSGGNGWVYQTAGDYTVFTANYSDGTNTFSVPGTWITAEATTLASLQLIDDVSNFGDAVLRTFTANRVAADALTSVTDVAGRNQAASRKGADLITADASWGMYAPPAPGTFSGVTNAEALLGGHHMAIVMWYTNWNFSFATSQVQAVLNHGSTPMISWQSTSSTGSPVYSDANIAAGVYDSIIIAWANAAKALAPATILLRFDYEMNGSWMAWYDPTNYVAMWRHVHDVMQAQGATNVKWVWAPNVTFGGAVPMSTFWPGDDYVDYLGLDGYNFGDGGGHTWTSFHDVFAASVLEITALSNKPLLITETGCNDDPIDPTRKPTWITDALTNMRSYFPMIDALVWFDSNEGGGTFKFNQTVADTAAFNAGIQAFDAQWPPAGVVDAAAPTVALARSAGDNLPTVGDSAARSTLAFSRLGADSLPAVTDVSARLITAARIFGDTVVSLTEALTTAVILQRTFGETLAPGTDTATPRGTRTLPRFAADSFLVVPFGGYGTDAYGLAAYGSTSLPFRVIGGMAESIAEVITHARTAGDVLAGVTDSPVATVLSTRLTADTIAGILDSVANSTATNRLPADTVAAVSDVVSRAAQAFVRTSLDTLAAVTDATATAFSLRAADILPAVTDAVLSSQRRAADALPSLTEIVNSSVTSAHAVGDSINAISDAALRQMGIVRTVSQTLGPIVETVTLTRHNHVTRAAIIQATTGAGSRIIVVKK